MSERTLLEVHPWLSTDDLELLEERPWIVPFIEADDPDLSYALRRVDDAVVSARAELRARGDVPHQRMVVHGGIPTTAWRGPGDEVR